MTIPVGEFGAVIGRCSTPVGGEHNKRKGGLAMRKSRKIAIVAGSTVGALAIGGVAFAYWTNSGSGSGSAATGSNSPIVVNQTSLVTAMAPGVAAQPLSGNFTNLNDGPVFVHSVSATVSGTNKPGCGASDYTIAGTATVDTEVAAGTNVGAWSGLSIQFNDKTDTNQDACKGALVSISYTSD